ncbi:ribosomal protein S6 kinase delta-1 isoform X1 [Petromyzon marinus]|uniref:ribosomal protein S6 kinase delta-1 isoform X1 n=2 Tax=Petromyzon marinus TaxID=7757 RepID=UPI003F6F3837
MAGDWGSRELARFYTVSDKGRSLFAVTAHIVSRSNAEDVFKGGVGQTCPPLQRVTTRNGLWLPLVPPLGPGPSPGTDQGWYSGHGLEHASRVTRLSGRTATETRESPRLPHDGTGAQTPELSRPGAPACLDRGSRSPATGAMAFPESSPPGGGSGVSSGTGPLSKAASYLDRVRGSPSRRAGFDTAGGKGAYLLQAAAQIRLALEEEAAERYEGAFNHYQSSVGLLLRGVQADPDPVRREAVRRKTQQYLMRAEHIFTQHLGNGPAHSAGFSSLGLRHMRSLSGPPEELKYYKVLSIFDKVLLVKDQNTGEKYILKSVRKTSGDSPGRRTVLPQGVPYMVPLLRYYITDDSIFLLLQHVQGGRLWSHVKKQFSSEVPFEGFVGQRPLTCRVPCGMRGSVTSPNLKQYAGATPGHLSKSTGVADPCDSDDNDDEGEGVGCDVTHRMGYTHPDEPQACLPDAGGETRSDVPSAGTPDSQGSGHVCGLLSHSVKECLSHNSMAAGDAYLSVQEGMTDRFPPCQAPIGGTNAFSVTRAPNDRVPTSDGTTVPLPTPAACGARAASDCSDSASRSPSKATGRRCTPGPRACSRLAREDCAEKQNGARSPVRAADLKLKPSPVRDRCDHVPYTITVNPFEVIGRQEFADDAHCNSTGNFSGFVCNYDRDGSYLALTQKDSSELRDAFASYSSALSNDLPFIAAERKEHLCNGVAFESDGLNSAGESSHSLADPLSSAPGLINIPREVVDILAVDRLGLDEAGDEKCGCNIIEDVHSVELNPDSVQLSFGATYHIPNGNGKHFCASLQDSSSDAFEQIAISAGNEHLHLVTDSRTDPGASRDSTENGFDDSDGNERSQDEPGLEPEAAKLSYRRREKSSTASDTPDAGGGSSRGGLHRRDRLFVAAAPPSSRGGCPVRQPLAVPEEPVRVWAAQLVQALDGLHKQGLVCGDLNPRNILLESTGHIRVTYFSQWSEVEKAFSQTAVQDMYCAPEIVAAYQETEVSDWWSFGVLLYGLLTGEALCHCHPTGITAHTKLSLPTHLSDEAQSLLRQLLQFSPAERLGAGPSGADEIRLHHFFASIDWDQLHG